MFLILMNILLISQIKKGLLQDFVKYLNGQQSLRVAGGTKEAVIAIISQYKTDADGKPFIGTLPGRKPSRGRFIQCHPGLHVSGCPWSRHLVASHLSSPIGSNGARLYPIGPSATHFSSAIEGITKGFIPCPHCQPDQSIPSSDLKVYLAQELDRFADDTARSDKPLDVERFRQLIILLRKYPSAGQNEKLRPLLPKLQTSSAHRDCLKQTVLELGSSGTAHDLDLLDTVMVNSPFWDLRMVAAAAIGEIGGMKASLMIEKASVNEPYYFVKRWMSAALLRTEQRSSIKESERNNEP